MTLSSCRTWTFQLGHEFSFFLGCDTCFFKHKVINLEGLRLEPFVEVPFHLSLLDSGAYFGLFSCLFNEVEVFIKPPIVCILFEPLYPMALNPYLHWDDCLIFVYQSEGCLPYRKLGSGFIGPQSAQLPFFLVLFQNF